MRGRVRVSLAMASCLSPLLTSHLNAQPVTEMACGTFEYSYPYNTEQLNENHFIVLDCQGDVLRGWYYGTSDDFDRGREGYLPGFFVAAMSDLAISDGGIQFTIQLTEQEYFARPVPLMYRDAEQVPADQNEPWAHGIRAEPRQYQGIVSADAIVLVVDGRERIFSRVETGREEVLH